MIIVQLDSEQLSSLIQSSVRKVLTETTFPDTSPPANPPDDFLTVKQAAELLNLTVGTLYIKVSKSELPVCKAPGSKRLYFSRADLLEHVKAGRKRSNAEIEAQAKEYLETKKKGPHNGK